MLSDITSPEAAVAYGATLLDRIKPDWYRIVDARRHELDMPNPACCILGLTFAEEAEAGGETGCDCCQPSGYGYALKRFVQLGELNWCGYGTLSSRFAGDLWLSEVDARLAPDVPDTPAGALPPEEEASIRERARRRLSRLFV